MGNKQVSKIEGSIKKILDKYSLTAKENLRMLITQTLEKEENNVRFVTSNKSGKRYIFKYSVAGLREKTIQTGVRALLNLKNEVNFYLNTNLQEKQNIIIPKLLAASIDPAWLIIEFLENAVIFDSKLGFSNKPFPRFFSKAYIEGISELQKLDVNKKLFHKAISRDTRGWVESVTDDENIRKIFQSESNAWDRNCNYVCHMDILTDTIGYDKSSHKLVLLDFEKVQISHPAQDFAAITMNPLIEKWNRNFEKEVFKHFKSRDFEKLYKLTKLLRLLSRLKNYETGRLDHVFTVILGKTRYIEMKTKTKPVLEKEVESLVQELSN